MRSASHTSCFGMHTLADTSAPPGGHSPEGAFRLRFTRRNPQKAIWLKVRYVGGSQGFWEVETRGQVLRRETLSCFGELMNFVNGR